MTKRWAFRIAYLGLNFHGFQRQLDVPTVEEHLLFALNRARIINIEKLQNHRYACAARTDRGVSAIEQTIALDSSMNPNLNQINTYLPKSISVWAHTEVPDHFHPKSDCKLKSYSYFFYEPQEIDIGLMKRSAELIEGTHNFRFFTRTDPKRNQEFNRTVKKIEIKRNGPIICFHFSANGFLWQQCRRIVNHLIEIGKNIIAPNVTISLLNCAEGIPRPAPAPPEGLILLRAQYDGIKFNKGSKNLIKKSNYLNSLLEKYYTQFYIVNTIKTHIQETILDS